MNYETFKKRFAEDIVRRLAELGVDGVSTDFEQVKKPNEVYDAIVLRQEKNLVRYSLNAESLFADYEHFGDYESLLSIAFVAKSAFLQTSSFNTEQLTDYALAKERLFVEVINSDVNAELLSVIPHEKLEDLAIIYKIMVREDVDGMQSTVVTNTMLNKFGVSKEQLHEDALKNSLRHRPAVIKGMNEALLESMPPEIATAFPMEDMPEDVAYVATVPDKLFGAGVLAYPGFMERAAKKLGGSFYILPSSIHEIILLPDQEWIGVEALQKSVREINDEEVDLKDQLSNNVYHYDSKLGIFELAKNHEDKMQEKLTPFHAFVRSAID